MTRILGLTGSLRRGSYNRQLLCQAATLLPAEASWQEWEALAAVQPFCEDDEAAPGEGVQKLRIAITGADALLIATPEYNGSIPGQLKNAVDWLSRPPDAGVLTDKPAAVIGASPSRYGASSAQAELRKVLARAGARVLEREVPVTRAHVTFSPGGQLTDSALLHRLHDVVDELVAMAAPPDAREHARVLAEPSCA